jgi:small subunit ribosomal protein S16
MVAIDSRRARDGKFLETVGIYNPVVTPAEVRIQEDRLTQWLNDGAQPSDTVSSLLTQIGFLEKYEKAKKGLDVSDITLKTTITERRKKTRKMKKATLAAAEEVTSEKPAEKTADSAETPKEPAPESGQEEKPAE